MSRTKTRSYSERATLNCPECGRATTGELWLIIDTAARPDLVSAVRTGTLHEMVCPRGHVFEASTALLFYQSGEEPPLVFSPAEAGTAAQNRQAAAGYVAWLAAAMGPAWRDAWADDLLIIPRPALADFLSDTPALAAVDAVLRMPAIREVLVAIGQVLAAEDVVPRTDEELFAAIRARPELAAALQAAFESVAKADAPDTAARPPAGAPPAATPAGRQRRIGKRKGRR